MLWCFNRNLKKKFTQQRSSINPHQSNQIYKSNQQSLFLCSSVWISNAKGDCFCFHLNLLKKHNTHTVSTKSHTHIFVFGIKCESDHYIGKSNWVFFLIWNFQIKCWCRWATQKSHRQQNSILDSFLLKHAHKFDDIFIESKEKNKCVNIFKSRRR